MIETAAKEDLTQIVWLFDSLPAAAMYSSAILQSCEQNDVQPLCHLVQAKRERSHAYTNHESPTTAKQYRKQSPGPRRWQITPAQKQGRKWLPSEEK